MADPLRLGFDFTFDDLFSPKKLKELHDAFLGFLESEDPSLKKRYAQYLSCASLSYQEESLLLIETSVVLSAFLTKLFAIERDFLNLKKKYQEEEVIVRFKNDFVKKLIVPKQKQNEPIAVQPLEKLEKSISRYYDLFSVQFYPNNEEKSLALLSQSILKASQNSSESFEEKLKKGLESLADNVLDALSLVKNDLIEYVYSLFRRQEELSKEKKWASFCFPKAFDPDYLVPINRNEDGSISSPSHLLEPRKGFAYANEPLSSSRVLGELDYCLKCHKTNRDFCSKGARDPETKSIKMNEFSIEMSGCPLNQKISQSHTLARNGEILAALCVVMIDNPMCPGTGDRICNDCLTSCVYVKQESVSIPQNESAILHDVLYELPYGAEIYSLLTRWNPLNRKRPYMLAPNGKKALIVGCGPAGYTLSHYLSNEGVFVAVIDALKLEPIPKIFFNPSGSPLPVKHFKDFCEPLENRTVYGFGGVSEYGITVRFDKNLLLLLYLTLSRKRNVQFFGGVRFGSNLNVQDAWDMGYHHIALACGAGKPKDLSFEEHSPIGVSKASDFLMSLQSAGVFKDSSLASFDVKLPAVVIGGGLTAVDTAAELMAYYPIMVKKIAKRYKELKPSSLSLLETERKQLEIYLEQNKEIEKEEEKAEKEGRKVNLIPLLNKWGGVKLVYRSEMKKSQAYRVSASELEKAMHKGVVFCESLKPKRFIQDKEGRVEAVEFETPSFELIQIPTKSVFIAAGTEANTVYEKEHPRTFSLTKEKFFSSSKEEPFFTSYQKENKKISFFGDLHPQYLGKVVKAMASAKQGFPEIIKELEKLENESIDIEAERKKNENYFLTTVREIKKLSNDITQITLHNPLIAKQFKPGQFYKIQNLESNSMRIDSHVLSSEPVALTGTKVDLVNNLISFIVLDAGVSSKIVSLLKKGETVVCMGPTGSPTFIPKNKTLLLVGGGLGNAVLFSILKKAKEEGNKIIYFSAYRKASDIIELDFLKKYSDELILSCDEKVSSEKNVYHGNIISSIENYLGNLPKDSLLKESEHLVLIGSSKMMQAFKNYLRARLQENLPKLKKAILSINSPMQCMMKEVCGRCMQRHVDPQTKEISYVYSCFEQDQNLASVDLNYLNEKLSEHSISEKINKAFLKKLLNQTD